MAEEGKSEPRWQPLESNPDVLNKFMSDVGGNENLSWYDVFGLDKLAQLLEFLWRSCWSPIGDLIIMRRPMTAP